MISSSTNTSNNVGHPEKLDEHVAKKQKIEHTIELEDEDLSCLLCSRPFTACASIARCNNLHSFHEKCHNINVGMGRPNCAFCLSPDICADDFTFRHMIQSMSKKCNNANCHFMIPPAESINGPLQYQQTQINHKSMCDFDSIPCPVGCSTVIDSNITSLRAHLRQCAAEPIEFLPYESRLDCNSQDIDVSLFKKTLTAGFGWICLDTVDGHTVCLILEKKPAMESVVITFYYGNTNITNFEDSDGAQDINIKIESKHTTSSFSFISKTNSLLSQKCIGHKITTKVVHIDFLADVIRLVVTSTEFKRPHAEQNRQGWRNIQNYIIIPDSQDEEIHSGPQYIPSSPQFHSDIN